jgi:hypothetical protein
MLQTEYVVGGITAPSIINKALSDVDVSCGNDTYPGFWVIFA